MSRSTLIILIVALIIAATGILSIYSSTYQKEGGLWPALYQRQILWVILGLLAFLFMASFDYRKVQQATYLLYAIVIFLLILVFIIGIVRMGAQRWLKIAWFNFQPSEVVKLIMVIFLSRYFSAKSIRDISLPVNKFGFSRSLVIPFIFVAVPMWLVFEQPDLGSAVMIMMIFMVMVYLAGVRLRYVLVSLSLLAISLPLFWHFLRDYQKERLLVFLNPNLDPQGAGYTIIQSKIAIGSGGFWGKGWLYGTQSQLRFLPESHTDFIFATFVEEWGILGAVVLLWLYYILIRKGIQIGLGTGDYFARLLALGISFALGMQAAINIAMNLGLAPVVGLPLPLMSYGGSSMFVTFLSLGILANIERRRAIF